MDKQRANRKLLADQQAATAVEYGLIAALIVIAALSAIGAFATTTTGMWNDVAQKITRS